MSFNQSFISEFNLKEDGRKLASLNVISDLEENFCKGSNYRYEDISEDELFLESQQDSFISHVPPFDFERVSKNLFRLTLLLPGIYLENLTTEVNDNILVIKVKPSFPMMPKDPLPPSVLTKRGKNDKKILKTPHKRRRRNDRI